MCIHSYISTVFCLLMYMLWWFFSVFYALWFSVRCFSGLLPIFKMRFPYRIQSLGIFFFGSSTIYNIVLCCICTSSFYLLCFKLVQSMIFILPPHTAHNNFTKEILRYNSNRMVHGRYVYTNTNTTHIYTHIYTCKRPLYIRYIYVRHVLCMMMYWVFLFIFERPKMRST